MGKKLLSNSDKKIKNICFELFKLNLEFKKQEQDYKQRKAELQKSISGYNEKHKINGVDFVIGNSKYSVVEIKPNSIVFDVDKLEKKLSKEILNEIITKKYEINDIENLITYLKSCGVDPKKFKSFLKVTKTVDGKKVDELGKLGDITENDLEGCYEVVKKEGYIKITETELKE